MKSIYKWGPLLLVFVLGIVINQGINMALAHGGNANFIHSCVKNSNGSVRIVGINDVCSNSEVALDWNKDGVDSFGGFVSRDLSNTQFSPEAFPYRNFENANFSGADFQISNIHNSSFKNSTLTGVAMYGANASNVNFSNANLSDADFRHTNLIGANFSNAIVNNGIQWESTTCPDGTNSDNNGNTCIGHLVP